jgi:hypothetical protein
LDHLVVAGEVDVRNWIEEVAVGFFLYLFAIRFRPWRLANPSRRFYVGVGAFNMVRADFYRRHGGHRPLSLEVLDDVKLGQWLKYRGGRSRLARGHRHVRVRWVHGIGDMFKSLEKNSFAAFDYRMPVALGGMIGVLLMGWWPWIGLTVGPAGARLLCAAAIVGMCASIFILKPARGSGVRHSIGYPIASALVAAIMARSAFLTLRRGGVSWRGTFYPLAALRAGAMPSDPASPTDEAEPVGEG